MAAPSQTSPNQASQSADAKPSEDAPLPQSVEEIRKPAPVVSQDPPLAPPDSDNTMVDNAAKADVGQASLPQLTYSGTESSPEFLLAKSLLNDGDFDTALETIATAMSTTISRLPEQAVPQLHEAMAPLHYLYGTTLLYSIEESSDNLATAAATGAGPGDEEEADDSQIAWENLDVARLVIQTLLSSAPERASDDIALDLAQVHMRLGDLQRFNGRYQEAIKDYMACLEMRRPILGAYHRKVAELHHLLGVCCSALVAEGVKQQQNPPTEAEEAILPLLTSAQMEGFRTQSVAHYVSTVKSFAGQIAFLCGASPEEVTTDASSDDDQGGGKTTGMDPDELALFTSSRTVRAIRARVAALEPPTEHAETVQEYLELLEDLQETIDDSQDAKKGMQEMASMKAQLVAEASGEAGAVNADGSTTSIGFGSTASVSELPSTRMATTTDAVCVGSDGVEAAAPVMMVRKKNKRGADEEDSKMPGHDDSKRAKTDL